MSSRASTVLYLPGVDGTGKLLYRQRALREEHEVICASYPQDRPQTYESLADGAAALLDNVSQPVTVLAESFGGAVAITLALRRPELISRLILVNTFSYFPKRLLIRTSAFLSRFAPARPSPKWSLRMRERYFFSSAVERDVRDEWWRQVDGVPLRAYSYRLPLIAGVDLRARLSEVQVPTMLFLAPDDRVVPPAAGRELAKLLPKAVRVMEQPTAHGALVHPDVNVAQWIRDFPS